ncbi:MAG: hypothetical protein FGM54_00370 [Chitinophagaceae bacterium]|nr:hypothetical protein [Chitinophagaceae bacterium]
MKIKAVYLLRCLLLLVVSCLVLPMAKAYSGPQQNLEIKTTHNQAKESVWKTLMDLLELEEEPSEDQPEELLDESENFDYTIEHKTIELPPYWLNSPLSVFQCLNLSMLSQAEPDYQPRPPKA